MPPERDLSESESPRLTDFPSGGEGELMSGWLTKSPPTVENKKPIFNPKWRRRWFVLREGGVPGQYILHYYTHKHSKKQKGSIDLDQCYQVDTGLTYKSGKTSLSNLFNIKTEKRTYYLSADSIEEMNAWVQSLCQACGLRAYQTDENDKDIDVLTQDIDTLSTLGRKTSSVSEGEGGGSTGSTPRGGNNNQTHISGPYMHLADCFTGGGPPASLKGSQRPNFSSAISSGDISLTCGEDSVFLPSSPLGNLPRNTSFDDPGIKSIVGVDGAPSRPPKPATLRPLSQSTKSCGDTYENVHTSHQSNLTNQRCIQSGGTLNNDHTEPRPPSHPPPAAPSSLHLPPSGSGRLATGLAPQVDRNLKPGRGSMSSTLVSGGGSTLTGTAVRKHSNQFDTHRSVHSVQSSYFSTLDHRQTTGRTNSIESLEESTRNSTGEETIYYYMPSMQPNNTGDGKWDPIMIPAQDMIGHSIEYLDLDLPSGHPKSSEQPEARSEVEDAGTVYKTVDFVKTEAFNKTKQNVEDERYKKNVS